MTGINSVPVIGRAVRGCGALASSLELAATQYMRRIAESALSEELLPGRYVNLDEFQKATEGAKAPPITRIAGLLLKKAAEERTSIRLEVVNEEIPEGELLADINGNEMTQVLNIYLGLDGTTPDIRLPQFIIEPLFAEFGRFCRIDELNPGSRVAAEMGSNIFYFDAAEKGFRTEECGNITRSLVLELNGIRKKRDHPAFMESEAELQSGHFCLNQAEEGVGRGAISPETLIAVKILSAALAANSRHIRLTGKYFPCEPPFSRPVEKCEVRVDNIDVLPPLWTLPSDFAFLLLDEFRRIGQIGDEQNEGRFVFDYFEESWRADLKFETFPSNIASREIGTTSRSLSITLEELTPSAHDAEES